MLRRPALFFALLLCVLIVLTSAHSTVGAVQITATPIPYIPRFEKGDCPVTFPKDALVTCGILTVPENRSKPEGRQVKLAVAIGKAFSKQPQTDPVIYVNGGPGMAVVGRVRWWPYSSFRTDRDVIAIDQRGTGASEPSLDCPELDEIPVETLIGDEDFSTAAKHHTERALQCADRLTKAGIDLAQYTNTQIAADLEDLRQALGYRQVNLFAWSAGTRPALYMMRDFPQSVRAVILDSIFIPPGVNYYAELAPNAEKTLKALFMLCEADSECRTTYGNIEALFRKTVDQLNTAPALFTVQNPFSGKDTAAQMNGKGFTGLLYRMMYEAYRLGTIPKLIAEVSRGEYGELPDLLDSPLNEPKAYHAAMNHTIHCTEIAPYAPAQTTALDKAWTAADPHYLGFYHWDLDPYAFIDLCPMWPRRIDLRDNQPVKSTVPVLIFAGKLDPASPPDQARFAQQTLPNSSFLEFPTMGHFVWEYGGTCPKQIALGFLNAPDKPPDSSCIAEMSAISFRGGFVKLTPNRTIALVAGTAGAIIMLIAAALLLRRRSLRSKTPN